MFLALFGTITHAQDSFDGWSGSATIYGWLPSITGGQERQDGKPVVDLGPSSVLDALQAAFFGSVEARKGKTGIAIDVAYADLAHGGTAQASFVPGANPSSADIGTSIFMGTMILDQRFHENGEQWVSGYGGLRYYDVKADYTLKVPAFGFKTKRKADSQWVDAVIGLRAHTALSERFGLTGLADIGGFGIGESSNLSWQAIATLDYSFSETVIGRLGYRYLSIDKSSKSLSMDMDLYGPMIGLTWTF